MLSSDREAPSMLDTESLKAAWEAVDDAVAQVLSAMHEGDPLLQERIANAQGAVERLSATLSRPVAVPPQDPLVSLDEPGVADSVVHLDVAIEAIDEEDVISIEDILVAQPLPPSLPPEPLLRREGAKVVLVVDDDPSIRELMARALAVKYTVYEAIDGQRASEILDKIPPPDAIVSDVAMPRMDGLALARRIRANPFLKRVPIVFVTAKDHPIDVVQGINVGARHYITKPFKLKDLVDKVDGVVGRG